MSDHTQLTQDRVDIYLAKLRRALDGLPADDIEEILRELRGHIAERTTETDPAHKSGIPVEQILGDLGTPESIASLYRTDALVARARATFSPTLIFRTTIRWATRAALGFVAFIVGLVGYGLGVSLIACALLKPFLPGNIGLWVGRRWMNFGFYIPRPNGPELLGWWIIPMGLAIGTAFLLGSTVFLRWMLRFVPSASGRVASLR